MSFDYNINLFNMILSDSDLSLQPIECACIKGHTDIVKLLLDNNCDVIDNNGFSLTLYSACKRGSVDIVDLLLRNKCNINQCRPGTNKSLLIVACDKRNRNQEAVAKMLLSYKACDVNITDCNNRNALHYACENGQADVVELLLRRHCNVNLNDKWMKTPLCIAFESGHVDIVKMFN
jgi:ankyrin repeat protein